MVIAAIRSVDPSKLDKPIRMTLVPEAEVLVQATCTDFAERGRDLGAIVVEVSFAGKHCLACFPDKTAIRVPLPAGDYEFEVSSGG